MISADALLEALSDRRRRLVLRYLRETADGVGSYEDLARYVSARSTQSPKDVHTCLHHVILPVLDDAELIEYDPRSEVVVYEPDPLTEDILDCIGKHRTEGAD